MKKKSIKKFDESVYQFSGDLTIYETAKLRSDLMSRLSQANELDLDLSNVAEIDTSGIQLLLSLKKSNLKVRLKNPTQAVTRLVQLLELETLVPETLH